MDQNLDEKALALSIGNCPNLHRTLDGVSTPCSRIVGWQTEQFVNIGLSREEARRRHQLPEAWAGNLSAARILFISSNPSFATDDNFPDSTWADDDVIEFFTRRFVQRGQRSFGAIDGPKRADQDRSIRTDGVGRQVLSTRVRTWQTLRKRAADILGRSLEDTRAAEHYALTEVVRCKSQKEVGVADALSTCVEMWLPDTLRLSPARLLVVSGAPAGIAIKQAIELLTGGSRLPDNWGSWKQRPATPAGLGRWPSSRSELNEWRSAGKWTRTEQEGHTSDVDLIVNGERRTYTIVWLPHPVKSVPQQLSDRTLVSEALLERWRAAAGPV